MPSSCAPLTGIVLMVEMTGDYALVPPLLAACLTAYGVADLLGDLPVYEALLEHDLRRAQPSPTLPGTLRLDVTIAPGAPFDGMRIRDLGLPPGAIVVTVRRESGEHLPNAEFRLAAGDRVTAVVGAEAAAAVPRLREGAGAER